MVTVLIDLPGAPAPPPSPFCPQIPKLRVGSHSSARRSSATKHRGASLTMDKCRRLQVAKIWALFTEGKPSELVRRHQGRGWSGGARLSSFPARLSDVSSLFSVGSSRFSVGKEHPRGLFSLLILFGSSGMLWGLNSTYAVADDASVGMDGLRTQYEDGEAYLGGLQRIEDGSIVANDHTAKWRIFTDNGRDLFARGKADEAEKYFLLALQEAKEGFGERDGHVASACNNLAELYRVRKIFDKAEPLYLEAISILEDSYGPEDIRVGAAFHNLGQFYLGQRRLEQAQTCYERALKIKGRVLGQGHPDYANTMYHLGTVLNLLGKEDSVALIEDSIRILEEGGHGESFTCVRRMKYLVQTLHRSDRLSEAEIWQRKILHVLELSKGWDSLETAASAENLAFTLQSLGNIREAQDLLERCLEVRKKLLPHDNVQVAANMLHLARASIHVSSQLRKKNSLEAYAELEKAQNCLDSSIGILRALLGNPKVSAVGSQIDEVKHSALMILLDSLDLLGLLEITRHDYLSSKEKNAITGNFDHTLRQFIDIFKQPNVRQFMMSRPDAKAKYLSCLKRLINDANEIGSAVMQELREEIERLHRDQTSNRRRGK